jgi:hypothetical protein
MREHTPEEWNEAVRRAIWRQTRKAEGCESWTAAVSSNWGYPIVYFAGAVVNIRQWLAEPCLRKPGHVLFFRATCGNGKCIRADHLEIVDIVPTATVQAMERAIRKEYAAARAVAAVA